MNTENQTEISNQTPISEQIVTCPGVHREQAFRRGSHLIGYGSTPEEAIANLVEKETR